MGIMGFFGNSIYMIRRRYDKTRERGDKCGDKARKLSVLHMLDDIEPILIMLEERDITRIERKRMMRQVRFGVEKARIILSEKDNMNYTQRSPIKQ